MLHNLCMFLTLVYVQDPRLYFLSNSIQETIDGMKLYRIDKESLVMFCRTHRKDYGHYTITGEHLAFYPFLQTHFRNHLSDLILRTGKKENEITLADVHDRLCSRGGCALMEKFGKNEKNQYIRAVEMGEMNTEKQRVARSLTHSRAHENKKRQVLAAKKDYVIVTCRYCKVPKEYFFLWSDYEERMLRYKMDSQKSFCPCTSNTGKGVGCTKCRSKCVRVDGPWKVVKVLVRNGNELGREDVIE